MGLRDWFLFQVHHLIWANPLIWQARKQTQRQDRKDRLITKLVLTSSLLEPMPHCLPEGYFFTLICRCLRGRLPVFNTFHCTYTWAHKLPSLLQNGLQIFIKPVCAGHCTMQLHFKLLITATSQFPFHRWGNKYLPKGDSRINLQIWQLDSSAPIHKTTHRFMPQGTFKNTHAHTHTKNLDSV